jgi:hypothetical protein
MSQLLRRPPYGPRDDALFLHEMNALTRHHLAGCPAFARIWAGWHDAVNVEGLPFVHVGVFKHIELKTQRPNIQHERTLTSSATSSGTASKIFLDRQSSALQSESSLAILRDVVGDRPRPLLIVEHVNAVRQRGQVSARVAAAMSLRPLATEIHFLLDDPQEPTSVKWSTVVDVLARHDALLVYGFTWILWQAWGAAILSDEVRTALAGKQIHFVHSGGWKKLEDIKVDRQRFDGALLAALHPDSRVVDYYGLVEQTGVIYPLCAEGFRHVPVWAEALVRDPHTLEPLIGTTGQLQLLNVLAFGAPYHSVLTEDVGRIVPGACACGRSGKRFELLGRIPKAEVRGCANA